MASRLFVLLKRWPGMILVQSKSTPAGLEQVGSTERTVNACPLVRR